MKFFAPLFIAFCILIATPLYADVGSFLVLKNTYLYPENGKGKKLLTRVKRAYAVLNMRETKKGEVQFLITVPWKKQVITGSGFIIQSEEDLKDAEQPMVRVFEKIPEAASDLTQYKSVLAKHLQLTGRKEVSKDFPNLIWKAVNYKTTVPRNFWVKEWAGLYRLDKPASWLGDTYKKSLKIKMATKNRLKVLLGLIETGFTSKMVHLSLGEPIERKMDESGYLEWQYPDKRVVFKADKVQQVL